MAHIGVITTFITGRGPPCSIPQVHMMNNHLTVLFSLFATFKVPHGKEICIDMR